jgi:tetratricopeptide (TPR) repeat protein
MLKIITKIVLNIGIYVSVFCGVNALANEKNLTIKLAKPSFILPAFTGLYSEREASIAPEEYETAERLREMLDSNQKEAVLAELENFFDIELSPAMLSLKAQIYFALKQYQKAEQTFLKVLSRKPQLVRVHRDLGQLYLILKKPKLARHHFSEAVSFGSNEAIVYGQLGYLNLTLHGAFSAISSYQQAMALQPEEVQWQQGLLNSLSQAKMYESASALLDELIAKDPTNKDFWLNQAILSLNMNNTKQALISLEMAIMLGESDDSNISTATQLHLQMHSYDRALVLIEQHLNKPILNMVLLNEYLTWLNQAGMWHQAGELLDNLAIKVEAMQGNEQSVFYAHKAKVAIKKKQPIKVVNYFNTALEKDPTNGDALIDYAIYAVANKDYIKAEVLYTRAAVIPKNMKQALLGKAQLSINNQDYRSALEELQKAYSRFPELNYLPEQINIIKNIIRTKQKVSI